MYIITQKGKSCHYCSKLVWLSSVEYISPLFFSFTFSLRCRGPMTAVWSVRCLQRHRATSTMTSSSILCARCQEELHWLIGKCLGDSYCSFSDYILIQQFLYMWCVYIFLSEVIMCAGKQSIIVWISFSMLQTPARGDRWDEISMSCVYNFLLWKMKALIISFS